MLSRRVLALLLPLAAMSMTSASPPPANAAASAASEERIAWWRDAKFGLFIHWGPVSVVGTEIGWSRAGERRGYWGVGTEVPAERYDNLYREFNPVNFDAAEWADIAVQTGTKYLVFTTRHHDGFSLWDTEASDYKITSPDSPYGRDIVRPLADATRAAGLRFGMYYSQPDWRHPDAFTERHAHYQRYLARQVRELMTGYGRIDLLWFDGLRRSAADYGAVELHQMIRALQPQILINNRNGLPEDFDTPEQRVGRMEVDRPWESCITLCRQWAWKPDDVMKSLDELLRMLVMTVTGGGNLLLNVGPMPDGRIEPRQVQRLREIGAWLRQHGTAVYGTRAGPWVNGSWGGSTHRGETIYVHVLQPPVNGRLVLAALPHRITTARQLGRDAPVAFAQTDSDVALELGPAGFASPVTIIELTLAEPVAPGQLLGRERGPFADPQVFGFPMQSGATARPSSGEASRQPDGRWTVTTGDEARPAVTLDLGRSADLTAVSAVAIAHNAFSSNVDLRIELSPDGADWQEVWSGSYGLPQWDVPLLQASAPDAAPVARPARYVRLSLDFGSGSGSLQLGSVAIYAR